MRKGRPARGWILRSANHGEGSKPGRGFSSLRLGPRALTAKPYGFPLPLWAPSAGRLPPSPATAGPPRFGPNGPAVLWRASLRSALRPGGLSPAGATHGPSGRLSAAWRAPRTALRAGFRRPAAAGSSPPLRSGQAALSELRQSKAKRPDRAGRRKPAGFFWANPASPVVGLARQKPSVFLLCRPARSGRFALDCLSPRPAGRPSGVYCGTDAAMIANHAQLEHTINTRLKLEIRALNLRSGVPSGRL